MLRFTDHGSRPHILMAPIITEIPIHHLIKVYIYHHIFVFPHTSITSLRPLVCRISPPIDHTIRRLHGKDGKELNRCGIANGPVFGTFALAPTGLTLLFLIRHLAQWRLEDG